MKQKILLHLMQFTNTPVNSFTVSFELTQDGIANVVGITRAHVSVELKKLLDDERIVRWKAHMLGTSSKRLAYVLTASGLEDAKCLSDTLLEKGIIPSTLLDVKRCNPEELWQSLPESDKDILGMACVFRKRVPRTDLPRMSVGSIPVDREGYIAIPPGVAKNYISFATASRQRSWHSWAADYWLSFDEYGERLYHLIMSNRMREAGRCIAMHSEYFEDNSNSQLMRLLKKIIPDPESGPHVYALSSKVALSLNETHEAMRMADRLASISDTMWRALKAAALARMGRRDEARQLALTALENENSVEAALVLGEMAIDDADPDMADAYSDKAALLISESENTRGMDRVVSIRKMAKALRACGPKSGK